ncbi:Gfo/Idh/MocA family oxidoreductase [bacterium]|nr:Gfo/Idh/MocA family oxidoreductase [bacterium]
MKKGKEIRSRFFSTSSIFNYIPDEDRYLSQVEKPEYKFNIIGTGIMGQEHIRITILEGRATVRGVYDPNPQSVETAKQTFAMMAPGQDLIVYDSLEKACNDPEVDGLIICTPNYTHIDVVRIASQSGKHILLEKPMATTIPDAAEITRIANDYKAVFQIGLQYRYKAMYIEAIYEGLKRKSIGDIKLISIMEHRLPFLDKVSQWNKFSRFSGGTLVEKCCHYFDLMNLFAQSKPVEVYASGSMAVNFLEFEHEKRKSDILDNAFVTVIYENNIRASFNLCMFAPMFYEEIVLCGNEGRLKAWECEDYLPGPRLKTSLEIMRGEGNPSRVSTPYYPTYIEAGGHNGATYYEHIKFIDNIKGLQTDTATVEEGFWSIVVGAAAEKSAKQGLPVKIRDLI